MKYTGIILLLLLALPAQSLDIQWTWTPPTTGTPVEYYEVELMVNDGDWQPFGTSIVPTLTTEMPVGTSLVRVRGVDEFGRAGGWSESSEPFIDNGPPGGCSGLSWVVIK
jgi:hypothetical protein